GERGDRRGLVVPRRGAQITLQQLVPAQEAVDLVQRGGRRRTRDVAHGRAAEIPRVLPAEVLEGAPRVDGKHEVVVVDLVLGNRDLEQELQHLHGREAVQQVE